LINGTSPAKIQELVLEEHSILVDFTDDDLSSGLLREARQCFIGEVPAEANKSNLSGSRRLHTITEGGSSVMSSSGLKDRNKHFTFKPSLSSDSSKIISYLPD